MFISTHPSLDFEDFSSFANSPWLSTSSATSTTSLTYSLGARPYTSSPTYQRNTQYQNPETFSEVLALAPSIDNRDFISIRPTTNNTRFGPHFVLRENSYRRILLDSLSSRRSYAGNRFHWFTPMGRTTFRMVGIRGVYVLLYNTYSEKAVSICLPTKEELSKQLLFEKDPSYTSISIPQFYNLMRLLWRRAGISALRKGEMTVITSPDTEEQIVVPYGVLDFKGKK